MRHFGHLAPGERDVLFHRQPAEFTAASPVRTLSAALGGTLYTPATRPRLAGAVRRQAAHGVASMVLCLEDAIGDADVAAAETNLVDGITELAGPGGGPAPLLFVRVRHPGQITALTARLGPATAALTGFVLPKFTDRDGAAFLEATAGAEHTHGSRLLVMPVLESPELLHLETRAATLHGVARLLETHRERVLAVRLGVTDLCSAYGLRRAPDTTAYDIAVVASVIGDVVNVLGRADGTGHTLTGPVWEYFPRHDPLAALPPREDAGTLPPALVAHDLDGLLREVALDRANGLQGKTCIHPSHVSAVHAASVVTHEEYTDAADIAHEDHAGGGVLRSAYTNKMNEVKPHRAWASRTLRRAEVFGVARAETTFVELLAAARGRATAPIGAGA